VSFQRASASPSQKGSVIVRLNHAVAHNNNSSNKCCCCCCCCCRRHRRRRR
jgi:hypothetical protein